MANNKKVILPTDNDPEPSTEYIFKDDGIYKEDKLVVSNEDVIKKEFTIDNGIIKAKDGAEVVLTEDFFKTFVPDVNVAEFEGKEYKVDDKGNLLDDAGNIYKAVEDYNKYLESAFIELEDKSGATIKLKLDKDGNALSKEGKVLYTKDELTKFQSPESVDTPIKIEELIKKTNLQVYDAEGKPVIYDDSVDGHANYIIDVYNQGKKDSSQSELRQLYTQIPELENIVSHVVLNGSLEGYNKNTSKVTSIKIDDKTSESDITAIIVQAKMMKGETEDEAKRLAKYYIADGKGIDAAKSEQQYIISQQKEEAKLAEQRVRDTEIQQMNGYRNYWGGEINEQGKFINTNISDSVYDLVINKKELKLNDEVIKLPSIIKRKMPDNKIVNSNLAEFFDYLVKPLQLDINGETVIMTAAEIDREVKAHKTGKAGYIYESLLNFTGGDLSQLVKQEVKQQEVSKIKRLRVEMFPEEIKVTPTKTTGKGKVVLPMD